MRIAAVARRDPVERVVSSALQLQIDAATKPRSAGRCAVEKRARAVQHLHAIKKLRRDELARGDAV